MQCMEVSLKHRIGPLALDMAFTLDRPWTVLFAPSGAGKSTVLRVIAGLVRPDEGLVASTLSSRDDRCVLTDTSSRVFVPPHRRGVRFIGQQAALFPHRTARQNVLYGMKPGERSDFAEIERICRIGHVMDRLPAALSGGERQRVALARAMGAGDARALLLDEPFTGLDAGLRDEITLELREWLRSRGIPVLHVTHDVGEAFALADGVIRLGAGRRVVAQGPAAEVLRMERERLLGQLKESD